MTVPDLPPGVHLDEVLFEFRRVGRAMQVAALDPVTRTEITLVAPPGYGRDALERLAVRKLAYVLAKRRSAGA